MAENKQLPMSQTIKNELTAIGEALPKDFNTERFVQNAIALLNDNPKLTEYSRSKIIAGLLKGARLGLDFYSKECYLIPYGKELNFQIDYRGASKLAKKYSIRPIKDIYAKIVRKGDEFEETIVNGMQSVNFKPLPFNTEPVIGAFAVCLFKDGGMLIDTMTLEELETTRKQSKAANANAWKSFTTEMYKKTVLHRLCKHIEIEFENPEQKGLFTSDVEIMTDTQEIVEAEISENANKEEFVDVDAEVVE